MDTNYNSRNRDLRTDREFFSLILGSFERIVGTPLIPINCPLWLYKEAPFALVAHNTQPDPRFIYGNCAAQSCFEYSWEEFTKLPSRLSAEEPIREERQQLLDAVTTKGFVDNFRGVRIAKSGRRFYIEKGVVWQLINDHGRLLGQAAMFTSWRDADDR